MTYCDDWPRIRKRYEAFWQGEIVDRPLVQVTSRRPDAPARIMQDSPPEQPDRLFDWYTDADLVIPRLERAVARTHFAGDAFPVVFPVSPSLVAIEAAYLGGDYTLTSGTAWCNPIIEDWATRNLFRVDTENRWWLRTKTLLQAGARAFEEKAAVGIPDLQGGGQILDLLRGAERLAVDLVESPYEVDQALVEIDRCWTEYWRECNDRIRPYQDGYVDCVGVWSDRPAVTVECDFSIMVSPEMFVEFFVPSLERQIASVERTIYHLDGEGAIRHLDALLGLEGLDGIQWVPGAGAKAMTEWIPLLRRIQDAGKRVVAACGPAEVEPLLSALQPAGLLLSTRCGTPAEADALVERVAERFG